MQDESFDTPFTVKCDGTNRKLFECMYESCDKSYNRNSHLKRHIESNHNTNKQKSIKLQCEFCKGYFSNKTSLKVHIHRFHSAFSKNCNICRKVFKKETLYQEHMLLFHHLKGNTLESYECELCGKKLSSFVTFRRHKKKHLLKQYKCTDENCTAIFSDSSSLLEHKKSFHYFQKKYKCAVCDKEFENRRNFVIHLNNHSNSNNFFCPHQNCDRSYSHKKNLKQHIQTFHFGKKFKCRVCMTKLSTKQKLDQHMVKIHFEKKPDQK